MFLRFIDNAWDGPLMDCLLLIFFFLLGFTTQSHTSTAWILGICESTTSYPAEINHAQRWQIPALIKDVYPENCHFIRFLTLTYGLLIKSKKKKLYRRAGPCTVFFIRCCYAELIKLGFFFFLTSCQLRFRIDSRALLTSDWCVVRENIVRSIKFCSTWVLIADNIMMTLVQHMQTDHLQLSVEWRWTGSYTCTADRDEIKNGGIWKLLLTANILAANICNGRENFEPSWNQAKSCFVYSFFPTNRVKTKTPWL